MPPPTPRCGSAVGDRERADRDRELGAAAVAVDPPDRAAVHAAANRFEVFDRLHDAWLRRAGDRRGWERRRARRRRGRSRRAAGRSPCSRGGTGRGGPRPRTARAPVPIRTRTHARGRCAPGRRSSRSRRGPSRSRPGLAASACGALDRTRLDYRAPSAPRSMRRNSSGDAETTAKPGRARAERAQRRVGRRVHAVESRSYSAIGSGAPSAVSCRVTFTW